MFGLGVYQSTATGMNERGLIIDAKAVAQTDWKTDPPSVRPGPVA